MRFVGSLPSKSLLLRLSSSSTANPPRQTISVLLTNSHSSSFSTTTGSSHSSSRRAQYDEESRSIKVSIWWDFENCTIPGGANVFRFTQSITKALRNSGIKGPITISAFGDVLHLPRSNQDALSSTGVTLTHVPHGPQGGKNSADTSLITDLMFWVSQNPPPAHLFLISSDKKFASVLHRLRMSNYNVLLASKSSSAHGVLCSAASIFWDWDGLINGENVTGKYFNQPPDGPYNSWYGHYRIPLLDPFESCVDQTEELSESSSMNSNSASVRPVPNEVVKKIGMILSLYPKGMTITELRAELFRSNVVVDKDFYGHKKFSRFLMSMPDILQLSSEGDGLFIVRAVTGKTNPNRLDASPVVDQNQKFTEKDNATALSPKRISDVEFAAETRVGDSVEKKQQQNVTVDEKHFKEESLESSREPSVVSQRDITASDKPTETDEDALNARRDSPMKEGFLQSLKRLWYGSTLMESKHLLPEDKSVPGHEDKYKVDKDLKSSSQRATPISQVLPSFRDESTKEINAGIYKIVNNGSSGNQKLVDVDSQEHEIFRKESFWSDVESFITSPRGFAIVSHSTTREVMAKSLQREGPSCLRELDESSMLHVVAMLISHKKMIEEDHFSSPPFRNSTGSATSHCDASESQRQKHDDERKCKSNAIADCQMLIKKITEECPEGYRLIRLKKDFLEEYGYSLAVEKLGYENLASLIQAMPRVRIESGYVLPSAPSPDDDKSNKEDDSDILFEELGPVLELSLSEDENSGSEREDNRNSNRLVMNGEDNQSSLLQILDSYYASDNGEVKEKPDEEKLVSNSRKQKPAKTYSFVKDS